MTARTTVDSSAGAVIGVSVCTAPEHQGLCRAAADDSGGVIVVWRDARDPFYDIYAQRIDRLGNVAITSIGRRSCAGMSSGNYPNPFNPSTTIEFRLPERGQVSLKIFDAAGRLVRTIDGGVRGAGRHTIVWDGRGAGRRPAASGVYLYRIETAHGAATGKMTLIR